MSTLLQTKKNETAQISERLRSLMIRLGLRSKEGLAEKLGYSRTQLFMIESGERPITPKFLAALAAVEEAAGRFRGTEQNGTRAPAPAERLSEDPVEYLPGRAPLVPATDAEITGLAALVTLRAAQISAGQSIHDVPIVADALERALGSRGWRVRE